MIAYEMEIPNDTEEDIERVCGQVKEDFVCIKHGGQIYLCGNIPPQHIEFYLKAKIFYPDIILMVYRYGTFLLREKVERLPKGPRRLRLVSFLFFTCSLWYNILPLYVW